MTVTPSFEALSASDDDSNLPSLPSDSDKPPFPTQNEISNADPQWRAQPPTVENFEFKESPGLIGDIPADVDPVYFFQMFLTDGFVDDMVMFINKYAEGFLNNIPARRRSRINWVPITGDDFGKFIALLLHMGSVCMPSYRHYWRTDNFFRTYIFRATMTRDHFEMILRFFNFGDMPHFPGDRLGKVRFLVEHFNRISSSIFVPHQKLSLDESMMLWRGRLIFRQYIKNKRHKYGVKFFELCSHNSYIISCRIYAGVPLPDENNIGQSAQYVIDLMNPFLNKGYHVFTDNYYNSVELSRYMSEHQTYITGTLRAGRKSNPKEVTKKKLKKGEMIWRAANDISVCKWKDKRDVLCISNAQPMLVSAQNRRGEAKLKPNLIRDYNDGMSAIDRYDQMLSYHSALRKTIRWYKKIGVHMFEKMLINGMYLAQYHDRGMALHTNDYRLRIVKWLLGDITSPECLVRRANFHYLESIPPTKTTIHKGGLSTFLTTENHPNFNLKQNTNHTISNSKPI